MNLVILIGNFCKNGDYKKIEITGSSVYNNTIAVKRKFKSKDGEYESDFINIVAFGAQAELLNRFCCKGTKIALQGCWQTRTYNDNLGNKHYVSELLVESITLLETVKKEQQPQNVQQREQADLKKFEISDLDLPF